MDIKHLSEIIPTRNILVVGDVMLDEYLWGHVRGISPEAPVPVVEVHNSTYAPGGAGNVSVNLASLGSHVWLAGVVGSDTPAAKFSELLSQVPGIAIHLYECRDRPTTTKTRIIAHGHQILRTDREERHPISAEAEADLTNWAREQLRLGNLHACILSDYAKGVLTERLLRSLIALCKDASIPVIVDPKGHHYSRYHGATVVTPNLAEANLAANNTDGALTLEQVAELLRVDIGGGTLLITQGAQGMSLLTDGPAPIHIPAQGRNIYDVTGAGDTVVAVLTLFLAAGADVETAAKVANYAAGIVVGKVGTASVTLEELQAVF
jgi:rfaE bifunctional protein kinase chain/domain